MSFFVSLEARERFVVAAREGLSRVCEEAFENITHNKEGESLILPDGSFKPGLLTPRGGPFSAQIVLFFPDGSMEPFGDSCGNNVVGCGVASCHAEHEALSPERYEKLIARLELLRRENRAVLIVLLSSAQSCTTCHTKQEIAARDLLRRGLIQPGGFLCLYGATYTQTYETAGFNDKLYADALALAAKDPSHDANLIHHRMSTFEAIPPEVRAVLAKAEKPTAVLFHENEIYAIGEESRSDYDLFSTAEVTAIRKACHRRRHEGHFRSWKVSGELYTMTKEIGPLLFAETGWTHIHTIVSVDAPQNFETRETPELSNAAFLQIVAGGYPHPERAVTIYRDATYANISQKIWSAFLQQKDIPVYNGKEGEEALLAMDSIVETRFSAPDLADIS